MAAGEKSQGSRLEGCVLVREDGRGIADLPVLLLTGDPRSRKLSSSQTLAHATTGDDGGFAIDVGELAGASACELFIAVLAPSDAQRSRSGEIDPCAAKPSDRLLHCAEVPPGRAGLTTSITIRLWREQVDRFSLLPARARYRSSLPPTLESEELDERFPSLLGAILEDRSKARASLMELIPRRILGPARAQGHRALDPKADAASEMRSGALSGIATLTRFMAWPEMTLDERLEALLDQGENGDSASLSLADLFEVVRERHPAGIRRARMESLVVEKRLAAIEREVTVEQEDDA